jgi:hypothetical protein
VAHQTHVDQPGSWHLAATPPHKVHVFKPLPAPGCISAQANHEVAQIIIIIIKLPN